MINSSLWLTPLFGVGLCVHYYEIRIEFFSCFDTACSFFDLVLCLSTMGCRFEG